MKYLIVTLGMACMITSNCLGQTPADDPIWVKQSNGSNEFNYNINGNKTKQQQVRKFNSRQNCNDTNADCDYHFPQNWYNANTQFWDYHNKKLQNKTLPNYYKTLDTSTLNIELSYGSLKIIARKHNPPFRVYYDTNNNGNKFDDSCFVDYKYTTTDIEADTRVTLPYYMEMRMRLPEGNHNGMAVGCWNYVDQYIRNDSTRWSEVDLFEYSGSSKIYTHDYHWEGYSGIPHLALCNTSFTANEENDISFADLYWKKVPETRTNTDSGWHTYGVEVTRRYVAWYIDGRQKQLAYFPHEIQGINAPYPFYQWAVNKIPTLVNTMTIEAGINTQPGFNDSPNLPDSNTVFPFAWEIDYLRYYRPVLTYRYTDINSLNYNLNTHPAGIYKSITLGGSGGSVILTSGNVKSLRSVNDIILNDGFEVQTGGEIYIINTIPEQ